MKLIAIIATVINFIANVVTVVQADTVVASILATSWGI